MALFFACGSPKPLLYPCRKLACQLLMKVVLLSFSLREERNLTFIYSAITAPPALIALSDLGAGAAGVITIASTLFLAFIVVSVFSPDNSKEFEDRHS